MGLSHKWRESPKAARTLSSEKPRRAALGVGAADVPTPASAPLAVIVGGCVSPARTAGNDGESDEGATE
jgi:hypothetical protein